MTRLKLFRYVNVGGQLEIILLWHMMRLITVVTLI